MPARLRFFVNIAVVSAGIYIMVLLIKGRPPISFIVFLVICEIAALPAIILDWIKEARRRKSGSG